MNVRTIEIYKSKMEEIQEARMNDVCKNCGKVYGVHAAYRDRCPLPEKYIDRDNFHGSQTFEETK